MRIAFYKGYDTLVDKMICWWTLGKYSHVELIDDSSSNMLEWKWYSASFFDGKKVRVKSNFKYNVDHWDIFELNNINRKECIDFLNCQLGMEYDLIGIFFSQLLPLHKHNKNKWFCSELCTMALVLSGLICPKIRPNKISPNKLFELLINIGALKCNFQETLN